MGLFPRKYKKAEVEHLLKKVLRETVDRSTLRGILEEVESIIGNELVTNLYEKMNIHEEELDLERFEYYIKYLNEMHDEHVF